MTDRRREPPSKASGVKTRASSPFPSSLMPWRWEEGESSSWIGGGGWSSRKKEGQEARERRKGNNCVQQRVRLAGRVMRHHGEAEIPMSNQSPHGAQGRRLLGPAALQTLRFSAKPSSGAPWARGLLSVFWEWGSPDLPACGPRRGQAAGRTTHLHQQGTQNPREGPSLARRTTQDLLGGGLTRMAREGWRDQGGGHLARSL